MGILEIGISISSLVNLCPVQSAFGDRTVSGSLSTKGVRISNGVCHSVAGLLDVRLGSHSGSGWFGFRMLTVLNNGQVEFKKSYFMTETINVKQAP